MMKAGKNILNQVEYLNKNGYTRKIRKALKHVMSKKAVPSKTVKSFLFMTDYFLLLCICLKEIKAMLKRKKTYNSKINEAIKDYIEVSLA